MRLCSPSVSVVKDSLTTERAWSRTYVLRQFLRFLRVSLGRRPAVVSTQSELGHHALSATSVRAHVCSASFKAVWRLRCAYVFLYVTRGVHAVKMRMLHSLRAASRVTYARRAWKVCLPLFACVVCRMFARCGATSFINSKFFAESFIPWYSNAQKTCVFPQGQQGWTDVQCSLSYSMFQVEKIVKIYSQKDVFAVGTLHFVSKSNAQPLLRLFRRLSTADLICMSIFPATIAFAVRTWKIMRTTSVLLTFTHIFN
jgi:hypothetical protein